MSRISILTKYFLQNSFQEMYSKKKGKIIFIIVLLLFCVFSFSVPFVTMVIFNYEPLYAAGKEDLLMSAILFSASSIVFVLGIYSVMNTFYFADDINEIMPLPFKSSEIVAAKFITAMVNMYVYTAIMVLPLITYGIISHANIIYYLYAAIVFIICPAVPMILSSSICMLIMRFTNMSKHKDLFRMFTGCMSLVLIILFNVVNRKMSGDAGSSQNLLNTLSDGQSIGIKIINSIFISNKLSSYGLVFNNEIKGFLYILGVLVFNVVLFIIYYAIAQKLYLKSIIGMSESFGKREDVLKGSKADKKLKRNSVLKALVIKDLKTVFRTPQYFINCVAIIFYMPAIMSISFLTGENKLSDLSIFLNSDLRNFAYVIAGCFVFGGICILTGGAANTALSREGKDLQVSKYIPVSYKTLLKSKIISSLCINEIGAIMACVLLIILKVNLILLILGTITSMLSILLITMIGLYLDFKSPNVSWKSEKSLFKKNYFVLIAMLIEFILGGIIFVISLFVKNFVIMFLISAVITIIASLLFNKSLIKLAYEVYNK